MSFTPNGIVTIETCPVCEETGAKVEHGHEADIDNEGNATVIAGRSRHLWHCPECGESLVWVVNCQACERATEAEAAREG
jgi:predicted RNA-binding Zn-ribbon protein involved in translation (DUF1610 family)